MEKKFEENVKGKFQKVVIEIEAIVESDGLSYYEALCAYCDANEVDIEWIASQVKKNKPFMAKISSEAFDLGLLKEKKGLPL